MRSPSNSKNIAKCAFIVAPAGSVPTAIASVPCQVASTAARSPSNTIDDVEALRGHQVRHAARAFQQVRHVAALSVRVEAVRQLDLFGVGGEEARERIALRRRSERGEVIAEQRLAAHFTSPRTPNTPVRPCS